MRFPTGHDSRALKAWKGQEVNPQPANSCGTREVVGLVSRVLWKNVGGVRRGLLMLEWN